MTPGFDGFSGKRRYNLEVVINNISKELQQIFVIYLTNN